MKLFAFSLRPAGFCSVAFVFLTISSLRAQVVADGATRTLINETNSFTGDVTVGTNGPFTLLVLSDNALLTNSAQGVIGRKANAKSNEVRLVSASARWHIGGSLQLGLSGAANRLTVSNGGVVRANAGDVGLVATGSNNVAVVTGSGSLWSNVNELVLGFGSAGNQLVVSNGGVVRNTVGYVGNDAASSNNLAVVTDPGSLWTNGSTLNVGFSGASGNQLRVSNGGRVVNSNGIMGFSATSRSNSAVLADSGSTWDNLGSLIVGNSGSGNVLIASNGATVRASIGQIGFNPSSSNNLALITGAGSVWSNANQLYVGFTGAGNRLVVSNGANVFNHAGTVGGDAVGNNLAVVTGAGSLWSNASLVVGNFGVSNRLVVSEGGRVRDNFAFVGVDATSSNNAALVTGSGSVWTNGLDLYIGWSSPRNQLVVSNGAAVLTAGAGFVGLNADAQLNSVTVTDPGTRWLLSSNLYVGNDGASSRFVVSNAALVANFEGVLGFGVSSSSNVALITGAGSVWSNRDEIVVGQRGNGNRLEVRDGARVESPFATLGEFDSASNNVFVVTDPGSFWRAEKDMAVGERGGGNRLVITNGGRVRGGGTIGRLSSSTNNEVVVTGAGSSWTNLNGLGVGDEGSRNRLVITNGGEVVSDRGVFLGLFPGATNNRIVVDGGALRSLDPVEGILDVRRGTNVLNAGLIDVTQLLLTNALGKFEFNGGLLVTRGAVINNGTDFNVGNSGGTPAVWDVRAGANNHFVGNTLRVGADSSFNQLILTNGALLTNDGYASLGSSAVARSNSVTLAGAGSRWRLSDGVFVGDPGSGNRLVVSNGASLITDSHNYIGSEFVATNNEALVTGPGSSWTSGPGVLFVGYGGAANRLLVSDGGQLVSFAGIVGDGPNSSNNLAVVTGLGSTWSNQFDVTVGGTGSGNQLVVSNGGTVFAPSGVYVGLTSSSIGGRLVVDGGTLQLTSVTATGVLDVRRGTNVLKAGLIRADQLLLTSALGFFEFNSGLFSVGSSAVNNGRVFTVGNGISPATFALAGNSTHLFANGLTISSNAILSGNGAISGTVFVENGGTLSPGASIGTIVLSNVPALLGKVVMEVSKNGSTLTNDLIQLTGPLSYAGSLVVTNIGPTALGAGDRFQLFSASSYSGSFSTITLPPLAPGLAFTNKLLLDGSIEVVAASGTKFASVTLSGTNLIFAGTGGMSNAPYAVLAATNVALPLSNWVSITTNQFDSGGNFSFTNGIAPGIPQRFYRIRIP